MRHEESQHQQAYFRWARTQPLARLAFAIPNGGARSKVTAAILKAEGVLAGVADVFLPVPIGIWHGLYIEFKAGDGRLTADQESFAWNMVAQGYAVAVAYDWQLAKEFTESYLAGRLVADGYQSGRGGISILKPTPRVNLLTAPLKKKPVDRST